MLQKGHTQSLDRKSTWQYGLRTAEQDGLEQRTGSYGRAVGGAEEGESVARGVYRAPMGAMMRVASRREDGHVWNERRMP